AQRLPGLAPSNRHRPPASEREQRLLERAPVLGELVDDGRSRGRKGPPSDHTVALELLEAGGEHVRADPRQSAAEVGEALRAEEQVTDEEQRPALADEVERASDTAELVIAPTRHEHKLEASGCKK